jgi:hypothetical protein
MNSTDKTHGRPGHLCSTLCGAAMLREAAAKPERCMAAKFLRNVGSTPATCVALYAHCDRAEHGDSGSTWRSIPTTSSTSPRSTAGRTSQTYDVRPWGLSVRALCPTAHPDDRPHSTKE